MVSSRLEYWRDLNTVTFLQRAHPVYNIRLLGFSSPCSFLIYKCFFQKSRVLLLDIQGVAPRYLGRCSQISRVLVLDIQGLLLDIQGVATRYLGCCIQISRVMLLDIQGVAPRYLERCSQISRVLLLVPDIKGVAPRYLGCFSYLGCCSQIKVAPRYQGCCSQISRVLLLDLQGAPRYIGCCSQIYSVLLQDIYGVAESFSYFSSIKQLNSKHKRFDLWAFVQLYTLYIWFYILYILL